MSELGQMTISSDAIGEVILWHDATAATVSGGYGGWKVVDRDRRKGLVQWDGIDPIRLSLATIFDGVRLLQSQEIAISRLSRMALSPDDWDEPPIVNVDGELIPITGVTDWRVENLTWGTEKVMWDFSRGGLMSRLRQDCVIALIEDVNDDRVAFAHLPPAAGVVVGNTGAGGWPRQYLTRFGDTLMKIASMFYKDANGWGPIADANGIRDPRNLTPGTLLRIPKPAP